MKKDPQASLRQKRDAVLWVETYQVAYKFIVFKSLPCASPAHLCITLIRLPASACINVQEMSPQWLLKPWLGLLDW